MASLLGTLGVFDLSELGGYCVWDLRRLFFFSLYNRLFVQMRGVFYTLMFALLLSCSSTDNQHSIVGVYETHIPSKFELFKYEVMGFDGYAGGLTLELFSDSTFTYTTCGHVVECVWSHGKNSVVLNALAVSNRISEEEIEEISLDSVAIYKDPFIFDLEGKKLINRNYNRMSKLYKKS